MIILASIFLEEIPNIKPDVCILSALVNWDFAKPLNCCLIIFCFEKSPLIMGLVSIPNLYSFSQTISLFLFFKFFKIIGKLNQLISA